MQRGKTIQQLSSTLLALRNDARDFVVPASKMTVGYAENGDRRQPVMTWTNGGTDGHKAVLNTWSHGQLASYADVPKAYNDRLFNENPILWAQNLNHGLAISGPDRRMVRTVDGSVRAFLSPKYRRLDSADLAEAILPDLLQAEMEVVSSDVTDRRVYLRAVNPRMLADVKVGDTVQSGIMISNSDVGAGALRVEPFIVRLVCMNGMVREHAFKKAHLGRSLAVSDDSIELLSDATLRLGEKAFWAEVKDVVKACLDPALFAREVDKLKAAADRKITNFNLQEVVEMTCRAVGLNTQKATQVSILDFLAAGNDGAGLTAWGLSQAFTAAAVLPEVDFDHAVELERAGGAIIDLSPGQWTSIAEKRR